MTLGNTLVEVGRDRVDRVVEQVQNRRAKGLVGQEGNEEIR